MWMLRRLRFAQKAHRKRASVCPALGAASRRSHPTKSCSVPQKSKRGMCCCGPCAFLTLGRDDVGLGGRPKKHLQHTKTHHSNSRHQAHQTLRLPTSPRTRERSDPAHDTMSLSRTLWPLFLLLLLAVALPRTPVSDCRVKPRPPTSHESSRGTTTTHPSFSARLGLLAEPACPPPAALRPPLHPPAHPRLFNLSAKPDPMATRTMGTGAIAEPIFQAERAAPYGDGFDVDLDLDD